MWVTVALFVWIFIVCEVAPVRGECDPSNAVVAVASVLSTLGFVMVVLAVAYLVVRRRRTVSRSLKFGEKRDVYGHVNNAYVTEDKDGQWRPESTLNTKSAGTGISIDKTWNSLPRKDKFLRLSKEGSYSSLNGNYSSTDPEVISVTLESQDIIGLGFNICGGYNDGIQVSEVNSRGPAKECGDIKVGDRILSVTVCYEHIVYEDALTILSYASPYPVKIRLQKASEDNVKTFDGKNIKVDKSRRLSHPLFRSRSLEAVKSSSHKDVPSRASHPKRTQSDLKSGHKLLKWPGKHSKKEKHSPTTKEDSATFKWQRQPESHKVNVEIEHSRRNSDIPLGARLSKIQDAQNSDSEEEDDPFGVAEEPEMEFNAQLTAASPSQVDSYSPKVIPDKPERKNRRKSDVPFGAKEITEAETILASNIRTLTATPPSGRFDYGKFTEEIIVPETLQRPNRTDHLNVQTSTGDGGKDISGALDILRKFAFKDHDSPIRSPSPDKNPVEEELILPESKDDQGQLSAVPPIDHDAANNNTKSPADREKPKNLNEEILEMLIAMNSFPPGTQGFAGLAAGGPQGGVTDDFVPNNLGFVPQPVPITVASKQTTVVADFPDEQRLLGGLKVPPFNNNGGLAYEIRDDLVTGQPFAVAITKKQRKSGESRSIVRSASDQQVMTNHDKQKAFSTLHTSASFDSSAGHALPDYDNATWNVDIGDQLSEDSDWLGSDSFQ